MLVVNEVGNDSAEENVSSQVDPIPVAAAASVGSDKMKDSDPLVLHVLPSAVTAECEYLLRMCSMHMYIHTYIFLSIKYMYCNAIVQYSRLTYLHVIKIFLNQACNGLWPACA